MADEPSDPLDGADIGETASIERTNEYWVGTTAGDDITGNDRVPRDLEAEAEVFEDDAGGTMVAVTYRGEVMKTLPGAWDSTRHQSESAFSESAPSRLSSRINLLVTLAVGGMSTLFAVGIFNTVARELRINGEAVQPLNVDHALILFAIWCLGTLIVHIVATRQSRAGGVCP